MKPSSILSNAAALIALNAFNPLVMAAPIEGTAAGLNNPAVLITFDAPPAIAMNAPVTDQYVSQGVTFDTMYENPFDPDNMGQYQSVSGNYVGNYQFTDNENAEAFLDRRPLTITFSNVQTRAAFGLQSNGGDDGNGDVFTFTAFLGGQFVESYTASVADGYYGFTDSQFDSIVVTSCVPTDEDSCGPALTQIRSFGINALSPDVLLINPDFYLLDNLQFDGPTTTPAAIPEPGLATLFGLGLFGAVAMRRRRSRSRSKVE